jgi:nucleotide-binding universal stress UspA family protein
MAIPTGAGPRTPRGGMVVGVDGSPGSLAALRWAIREASTRGRAVHAVTAWEVQMESTFGAMATVGDFHPVTGAERILVAALADADADVSVTTAPVKGHPPLLVVGSGGHGRIFGALLGSVSQYLAAHAACPVVVIKPLANQHGRRSRAGR